MFPYLIFALLNPFLFSPLSLFVKWLPALYLAAWPVIIQTLGREALIIHSFVVILFIITCDIARQTMLKIVGFDLISLPAGIALLLALATQKGQIFLSVVAPLFGTALAVVEPVFLLIEVYIFMNVVKNFNKWISNQANVRDEESQDLSHFDPPLTRTSLIMRLMVVLITISSYIGTYLIIQESKTLLGSEYELPIHFNQAIAMLVTLQLIAFATTIYKEEGIVSESALVALVASVPIFIASWSYYHLKISMSTQSGFNWSDYFPFALLGSSSDLAQAHRTGSQSSTGSGHIVFDASDTNFHATDTTTVDFINLNAFEAGLSHLTKPLDTFTRTVIMTFARRLIMLINSILGTSMDKLAVYYFGADFWYTLIGRLICIVYWIFVLDSRPEVAPTNHNGDNNGLVASLSVNRVRRPSAQWDQAASRSQRMLVFLRRLPLDRRTLVKTMLVLVYAQMLVQQIDNKRNLFEESAELATGRQVESGACCGQTAAATSGSNNHDQAAPLSAWFECMWTSARTCSGQSQGRAESKLKHLLDWCVHLARSLADAASLLVASVAQSTPSLLASFVSLWLARWRSPIIQRLSQSMLVQLYYICSLALGGRQQTASDYL